MSYHVPPSGPNVFADDPARPFVLVPVGGKLLKLQWPLGTPTRQWKNPEREIKLLKDMPVVSKPLARDPYQTLPLEEDIVPASAESVESERMARKGNAA